MVNYGEDKHEVLLAPSHQWSNTEIRVIVLIATGEKGVRFERAGIFCDMAIRGRRSVFDYVTLR